jgi:histidinol dehydrogenase
MTDSTTVRINRYVAGELSDPQREKLMARVQADFGPVEDTVREIVAAVRERGDHALVHYARELDGAELTVDGLKATEAEFARARAEISPELKDTLERAIVSVRKHHRSQLSPPPPMAEVAPGVMAGERLTPITSVGLYVPRGKGSFPSVMTMLCTPAVLVEVPSISVCTPPAPDGSIDAASLVAAELCGVTDVYKVGGAQAIAAMAFGTETVPRVQKLLGPGNRYVTAAKRLVYGWVDPGPPAGPSESIVLCDSHADPEIAARELLVEAEHGPDSAALLITDSEALADAVEELVPPLVERLPQERREYCEAVLGGYGGIVVTADLTEAIDFVNEYAPEHLRVLTENPMELLPRLRNAGEVLLGENASIAFGNYSIGVNAILPTGGTARSYSCVGVHDFLKWSSFAQLSREGVENVGPVALDLARYEGFPAHAEAARYVLGERRSG